MIHLILLTERELDVLAHLSNGLQNKEIALNLEISVNTVEQHLKNIYKKLEIRNRTEAALLYWKEKREDR